MSEAASAREQTRRELQAWFARSPGRQILDAELDLIGRVLPDLFGYYLLQVGRLSPVDMLAGTRVLCPVVLELGRHGGTCVHPRVCASADALPVASDSVDVVLLPHVLEFEEHPHEALRESQRVLVPEGHLLVCGFNPWSLIGLSRLLFRGRSAFPWSGHFLGLNRVKDWLALLGFEIVGSEGCFFRPPLASEPLMSRLALLESAGRRAWPYFAGAYVVTARKKVIPLTTIRPRWSRRRRLVGVGLAEPTARVAGLDD